MFKFLIPIIFLYLPNLAAQDVVTSKLDSLPTSSSALKASKKKKSFKQFFKKDYPSPKKAVLLAIVPGMGQIYTKKYWKLPLVYGALGGVIYSIGYNSRNYEKAVLSLAIKDGTITGIADPLENTPASAVQSARNSFDKNKQLSWIGLIGFYLISAGDAFVDAHLKDFSVDDDISFKPILETSFQQQPVIGIGFQIKLSK